MYVFEVNRETRTLIKCRLKEWTSVVNIPKEQDGVPILSIAEGAFSECYNIRHITVPESVMMINKGGLLTSGLKSVDLPADIRCVDKHAIDERVKVRYYKEATDENFEFDAETGTIKRIIGLSLVAKVVIPDKIAGVPVKTLGSFFTNDELLLEEVVIPDSVECINGGAFWGCDQLKKITFGTGLKEIGRYAFGDCDSLKKVVIPDSVEKMTLAFAGCKNLEEIVLGKNVSDDLGEGAFSKSKLKKIVIPDQIMSIDKKAFYKCKKLREVWIGKGVERIEEQAFEGCEKINFIQIPEGVRVIGPYAFGGFGDVDVVLPDSIEEIDPKIFDRSKRPRFACTKTKEIIDKY